MFQALQKWAPLNIEIQLIEETGEVLVSLQDGEKLFRVGRVYTYKRPDSEELLYGCFFDFKNDDSGEFGFTRAEKAAESLLQEWAETNPRIWHTVEFGNGLYCLKQTGKLRRTAGRLQPEYCNDLSIKVEAWNPKDLTENRASVARELTQHILNLLKQHPFRG